MVATLQVGTSEAVFGVPASALAGRIVALEALWGPAATQRLCDQLADARDTSTVAAVLEGMLSERVMRFGRDARATLVHEAAAQLGRANVNTVADELGLSERQLRRVFHEVLGVSPKAFSKLQRFQRALDAAHAQRRADWASVAVAAGYYDQAHPIAAFRAIAGATPRALLGELRAAHTF